MAETINTLPEIIDIKAYAGDTLKFRVNVLGYDTYDWSGQIKLDHDSVSDGSFTVTVDATGADVVLDSVSSEALLAAGTPEEPVYGAPKSSLARGYYGVWDLQVEDAGSNPPDVRTIAQGLIEVYYDVTKVV